MAAALRCIRLKAKASSLTFSFEEEKMIVFDSSGLAKSSFINPNFCVS